LLLLLLLLMMLLQSLAGCCLLIILVVLCPASDLSQQLSAHCLSLFHLQQTKNKQNPKISYSSNKYSLKAHLKHTHTKTFSVDRQTQRQIRVQWPRSRQRTKDIVHGPVCSLPSLRVLCPAFCLFSALDKRFWHIISLDLPAEAATTTTTATVGWPLHRRQLLLSTNKFSHCNCNCNESYLRQVEDLIHLQSIQILTERYYDNDIKVR